MHKDIVQCIYSDREVLCFLVENIKSIVLFTSGVFSLVVPCAEPFWKLCGCQSI